MPPVVEGHSIEIDVTRLAVLWILMTVVTGASIWMAKDTGAEDDFKTGDAPGTAIESLKQAASRSAVPKSSGAKILDSITSEAKAFQESQAKGASAAFKLRFPDAKVGELLTESDDDDEYWTLVSDAAGRVEVPQGKRYQLEIVKDRSTSLDFLSSMGNKDARSAIVSLDLSESKIDKDSLSYLRFLPALEELDLSGTEIGDEQIDEIAKLSQLKKLWLDNTNTSEAATAKLCSLTHLEKLSLSHLDVGAFQINSLKLSIPACEVVVREGKS